MGTVDRLEGLLLEAASLVGDKLLDSAGAELFEGRGVGVLVSARFTREGRSDVSITMVPKSGGTECLDSVVATLVGERGCHQARLDARGRAVIPDVPDARYRLRFCRVRETGSGP